MLGWASELPVLVHMNYLEESQRPKSDDPEYWKIWTDTGKEARTVDWGSVADIWQEKEPDSNEEQEFGEVDAEQKVIGDYYYGDHICHEQKDQQVISNTNTALEFDNEEPPF